MTTDQLHDFIPSSSLFTFTQIFLYDSRKKRRKKKKMQRLLFSENSVQVQVKSNTCHLSRTFKLLFKLFTKRRATQPFDDTKISAGNAISYLHSFVCLFGLITLEAS